MKAKKRSHPWRENLESISMAIIVALLFKAFILEVSKIPSGSMQPTLMGNAPTQIFDRVLVDKLSFRFRDPKRWEIVVFKHPLERSRIMVKRLVGMPGEELKIEHGDIWTRSGPDEPWTIERRPEGVLAEHWKELGPARDGRPAWGVVNGDGWRATGREVSARGNGRARFRPDAATIADDYLDGYSDSIRRKLWSLRRRLRPIVTQPGSNPVGDLRLEGEVSALRGTEHVALILTEGLRTYEFRLPGPAATEDARLEIHVRDSRVYSTSDGNGTVRLPERTETGAAVRLEAGKTVSFAAENLDDRLTFELDGEVVLQMDVDPSAEQESSVSLAVRGDGADFSDLAVLRDLYYVPQRLVQSVEIPADSYFMLGDNTQDSADGRDWRAIRFRADDADGGAFDEVGNYRPAQRPEDSENPLFGQGPDGGVWLGFRNRWGDRTWFPRSAAHPGLPWPEPFVPRELIQGRALAVFWPLKPHRGLWRLAWLH